MKLYLASGNPHKVSELQRLADETSMAVTLASAREVGGMPDVVEDTGTFVGNARKKAQALRELLPPGGWSLADDSGICVDYLEGGPGVESAYFAGPEGDDEANLRKLIDIMQGVPTVQRGAHYLCVLVLLTPDGTEQVFTGKVAGQLLVSPQGKGGFGYDPLFVPDGFEVTFAEMSGDEKNLLSHRARAWRALAEWLDQAQIE